MSSDATSDNTRPLIIEIFNVSPLYQFPAVSRRRETVVDISSGGNNALSETVNNTHMNYVRHSLCVGNTELDDYDK